MISIEIRNPENHLTFPEFIHNTTSIVAVPHGATSELRVNADRACTLVLEAGGVELLVVQIERPGLTVNLSEFCQPNLPSRSFGDLIPSFEFGPFKHRKAPKIQQRLYAFRAIIEGGTPNKRERHNLLATFDVHMLCDVDFHWARALYLKDVTSRGTHAIADKVEGNCPHCHEVRARLEKDGSYET